MLSLSESVSGTKKFIAFILVLAMVVSIGYFAIYKNVFAGGKLGVADAFMLMLVALAVGEIVSIKTKSFVPSIFISASLFIIGFWTLFPKDILQIGGIGPTFPGLCVMIMVLHLGTMLDKDELIAQWRTVVITLAGMAGIILLILTVGRMILGLDIAATAAPPLTGGLVSAIIMQGAVKHNQYLFILAMAIYVLQGFIGFPLINICLKREGRAMLKKFRAGELSLEHIAGDKNNNTQNKNKYRIFPETPKDYQTDYIILLKMLVLVMVSSYLEVLTKGVISKFVYALVVGVFAAEIGFIERKPLERSRSFGLFLTIIMMFVFSGLSSVTIPVLKQILRDFLVLVSIGAVGVALFSIPIGRKLGFSTEMSFAIGLGTLAGGFPPSYVLSNEAAKILSDNDEEYEFLLEHFLPKTLVSGFVSATFGSVLIAGFFASLFFK